MLCLQLGIAIADDVKVKVIALFANKALLQVGNQQKVVNKGEIFEGVLLQSASGRGAVRLVQRGTGLAHAERCESVDCR